VTCSIIEQIKDRNGFSRANQHIMEILGERRILKPTYYRHKETGAEYCYLAGGIGWPRDPRDKPGFAVVVGVDKATDEKPPMYVIEEAESPSVNGLLKMCVALQKKYGYEECPDLFRIWYGDNERTDTFVNLFNQKVRPTKKSDTVHVVAPHDFEKKNAFERYASQIWNGLNRDPAGKKRLCLGDCTRLRNHILSAPVDAATKGTIEEYPAIAALGGVVHTLMMLMPWTQFLKPERTIPTVHDPLTGLREDHERALWETGSHDYGEQEEYDNGGLVRTCLT